MAVIVEIHSIGDYLKLKMNERKLGVRETAKEIGTSSATVSRITNGKPFDIKLLRSISIWCELTPEELFDLLPEPNKGLDI